MSSPEKRVRIAIHQPHYVPWLGYLDRMLKADLFIVLDHVQFERRNYQNRTTIRLAGKAKLLTVPVVQLSQTESIVDKRVDNAEQGSRAWGNAGLRDRKRESDRCLDIDGCSRSLLSAHPEWLLPAPRRRAEAHLLPWPASMRGALATTARDAAPRTRRCCRARRRHAGWRARL